MAAANLRLCTAYIVLAVCAGGCANVSTYQSLDVGGSSVTVDSVNASASGSDVVNVTLQLRTAAGLAIPNVPAVISADGCTVTQASNSTDGNGTLQASLVSTAIGEHTVTATLQLSGLAQTLASQATINFYPGRPDGIPVATALNFAVNTARSYTGTVRFESSDPLATLPPFYTFSPDDYGTHLWLATVVLRTSGQQTVRVVDAQNGTLIGSGTFTMSPGDCSDLVLSLPPTAAAGTPITLTVAAYDGFGNIASRTAADLTLETSDGNATLPANPALQSTDAGQRAFSDSVTLRTAGVQVVRATSGSISSDWATITVQPQSATHLRVSGISSGRAGSSANVTVAAVDDFGNVVPTYTGAIAFTSSDAAGVLPQNAQIVATDSGTHTWSQAVTLVTAGSQWVGASDGVLVGQQTSIEISALAAVALRSTAAATSVAGAPSDCGVRAVDAYGNLDNSYSGQFVLSSSDPNASLPGPGTFTTGSQGVVAFAGGCIFTTAGAQTLIATDAARALAHGSATVQVLGGTAVRMQVAGLANPSSWQIAQNLTVSLLDSYNNLAQYTGTVALSSNDGNAIVPASHTYTSSDQGSYAFPVTLGSLGTFSVSAADSQNNALQGNQTVRVRRVESVGALADDHVCAILDGGDVKCWGSNVAGELGVGDGAPRGLAPGQMAGQLPVANLGTGRSAVSVGSGADFSCALLDNQQVKCWGLNSRGTLGLGDSLDRGGNLTSMGDALPTVSLGTGRTVSALAVGDHTCALLDNAQVKCWGHNDSGECGADSFSDIGLNPGDMGDNLAAASLGTGRTAVQVTAGYRYTCAVLDNGQITCWGGWSALSTTSFSGVTALQVKQGGWDLCALLSDGTVVCSTDGTGAGLSGSPLPRIALGTGRTATQLVAGGDMVCAILDNAQLKCWGENMYGQLGLGDTLERRAPTTLGDALPAVDLGSGRTAIAVAAGNEFTCALLDTHQVKCWGYNGYGALGLGDTIQRGSSPAQMGSALPVVPLW